MYNLRYLHHYMEEYQENKGTTAIFFQLAYSSTTFRNENGTFKRYL